MLIDKVREFENGLNTNVEAYNKIFLPRLDYDNDLEVEFGKMSVNGLREVFVGDKKEIIALTLRKTSTEKIGKIKRSIEKPVKKEVSEIDRIDLIPPNNILLEDNSELVRELISPKQFLLKDNEFKVFQFLRIIGHKSIHIRDISTPLNISPKTVRLTINKLVKKNVVVRRKAFISSSAIYFINDEYLWDIKC